MREMEIAFHIMTYELVVCVLLLLASDKIGHYASLPFGRHRARAARYTRLSILTLAGTWGLLIASLFAAFMISVYLSR